MTSRPRLAPLAPDELSDEQLALLEPVGGKSAPNLFRTMVRNPRIFRHSLPFSGSLLRGRALDPRDREIAILRVALRCQCAYQWAHHVSFGREVGLSDEEINRVPAGPSHPDWSNWRRAILTAVDETVDHRRISDETWNTLSKGLSPDGLIHLLIVIGNYISGAGTMNSIGLEVDNASDAPSLGSTEPPSRAQA